VLKEGSKGSHTQSSKPSATTGMPRMVAQVLSPETRTLIGTASLAAATAGSTWCAHTLTVCTWGMNTCMTCTLGTVAECSTPATICNCHHRPHLRPPHPPVVSPGRYDPPAHPAAQPHHMGPGPHTTARGECLPGDEQGGLPGRAHLHREALATWLGTAYPGELGFST
jgi:hypothetical protein